MRATSMAIGAILISAMGWASPGPTTAHPVGAGEQLTLFPAIFERTLPSFTGATDWISSQPLTASDLNGHVVVVQFWTYSCINWLRTAPYVRAWAGKYQRDGLVVIGVHSPEFEFEKNVGRVRTAATTMSLQYPIAVDSSHAIWNAFQNNVWPALYIIDARGRIRHRQFGEGGYTESERVIQQLLRESGRQGVQQDLVRVMGQGHEQAADWNDLRSPETYLGYARAERFASPARTAPDRRQTYTMSSRLGLNAWSLSGDWVVGREAVSLASKGGRIAIRFHARDLHLVMGSGVTGGKSRFRVSVDGLPPGSSHGLDVDEHGVGTLSDYRLYQLIRQEGPIKDHLFEIVFLDSGAEAFSFTFG